MTTKQVITDFAVKFLTEHWEEINLKAVHIKGSKEKEINRAKKDFHYACWIITEVMVWGTKIDYLREYEQDNEDDDLIIKIEDRYFKFLSTKKGDTFVEVFPKFKQVLYFSILN